MKMFLVHFNTLQVIFSKANAPAKWPGVMSRNARDYLAQGGSLTITTEIFPENESNGTQLHKFTARALPTSEVVGCPFRTSFFHITDF